MKQYGKIIILSESEYKEIQKRFLIQEERAKFWRKGYLDCTSSEEPDLLEQPYGYGSFMTFCRYCKNRSTTACDMCKRECGSGYLPERYNGPLDDLVNAKKKDWVNAYGRIF